MLAAPVLELYLWRPERESVAAAEVTLGSVYATLGIFLLIAVRNPSAHASLIAFTAWPSFAHGGVLAVQAVHNLIPRTLICCLRYARLQSSA
jgi:hypothetical protein